MKNLVKFAAFSLLGMLYLFLFVTTGHCKDKPGVARSSVSPKQAVASPGRPAEVRLRVMILEPTDDFFCPEITVEVSGRPQCDSDMGVVACGDSIPVGKSVYESDCDPSDRRPWTWSRSYGLGPGAWKFNIRLTQGKKSQKLDESVSVR